MLNNSIAHLYSIWFSNLISKEHMLSGNKQDTKRYILLCLTNDIIKSVYL